MNNNIFLILEYHHFEIVLLEKFSDSEPPPAIALCTASPLDPPPISQFRQDYLRFWPTGDAARYLKQGDKIGWGILFPQDEDSFIGNNKEQLIICYLTVNRTMKYLCDGGGRSAVRLTPLYEL
ncbi:unnamed protein product [Rotaria sp. Silwood1]|nr:unnamed protein product [Rotaria sp. Silwood1]